MSRAMLQTTRLSSVQSYKCSIIVNYKEMHWSQISSQHNSSCSCESWSLTIYKIDHWPRTLSLYNHKVAEGLEPATTTLWGKNDNPHRPGSPSLRRINLTLWARWNSKYGAKSRPDECELNTNWLLRRRGKVYWLARCQRVVGSHPSIWNAFYSSVSQLYSVAYSCMIDQTRTLLQH